MCARIYFDPFYESSLVVLQPFRISCASTCVASCFCLPGFISALSYLPLLLLLMILSVSICLPPPFCMGQVPDHVLSLEIGQCVRRSNDSMLYTNTNVCHRRLSQIFSMHALRNSCGCCHTSLPPWNLDNQHSHRKLRHSGPSSAKFQSNSIPPVYNSNASLQNRKQRSSVLHCC